MVKFWYTLSMVNIKIIAEDIQRKVMLAIADKYTGHPATERTDWAMTSEAIQMAFDEAKSIEFRLSSSQYVDLIEILKTITVKSVKPRRWD